MIKNSERSNSNLILGIGVEETHHPWSSEGMAFTSWHRLDHLMQTVIPLANIRNIQDEPPLTLAAPPNLPQLVQKSVISAYFQMGQFSNLAVFKVRGHAMRDACVREGKGDKWSE